MALQADSLQLSPHRLCSCSRAPGTALLQSIGMEQKVPLDASWTGLRSTRISGTVYSTTPDVGPMMRIVSPTFRDADSTRISATPSLPNQLVTLPQYVFLRVALLP